MNPPITGFDQLEVGRIYDRYQEVPEDEDGIEWPTQPSRYVSRDRRCLRRPGRRAPLYGGPVLEATAAYTGAAVLLAEERALPALEFCRRARRVWQHLDLPFEEAHARTLVARSCRALDDEVAAVMELETARSILTRLQARPRLTEVQSLLGERPSSEHGLTQRELEVLQLVAAGMTNAQIAGELMVSVRTVDTHISNILTKLGMSSRSAATAYAFSHELT